MRGKIGVKYASVALGNKWSIELEIIIHADVDGQKIIRAYLMRKGYNMAYQLIII